MDSSPGPRYKQRAELVAKVVWAVLLLSFVSLLVMAVVALSTGSSVSAWAGLPLLGIGSLAAGHSTYRLRRPDWRSSEWWQRHRRLGDVLDGAPVVIPGVSDREAHYFAAAVQFIVGLGFLAGGAVALATLVT